MQLTRTLAAIALIAAATACKKDSPVEPKPGEPVVTTMSCDKGNGQTSACEIPLTGFTSFTITLTGHDCEAHGNVLRLSKPSDVLLTEDGCYEPNNKVWGPYQGSATMAMTVTSHVYDNRPQLRVTQVDASTWNVVFEDGYDTDFNDMVFTVSATK
ncbi:MAG: hypothetical protein ACJ79S_04890 [Gemmatimonadaceae bacterium]